MILRQNTYLVSHHLFLQIAIPGQQVIFSCVFGFDVTRPQSINFSNQGEHIFLLLKQRQKMPSFFKSNSFWEQNIHTIPSSPWKEKIGPLFYLFVFVRTKKPIPQKSLFSSTLQQVCISSNLKKQLLCWNNQVLS